MDLNSYLIEQEENTGGLAFCLQSYALFKLKLQQVVRGAMLWDKGLDTYFGYYVHLFGDCYVQLTYAALEQMCANPVNIRHSGIDLLC